MVCHAEESSYQEMSIGFLKLCLNVYVIFIKDVGVGDMI